jgi:hypothetical protein
MALFLEPKGSTSLRVFGLNNAKGAISLTGLCWHPSPGARRETDDGVGVVA